MATNSFVTVSWTFFMMCLLDRRSSLHFVSCEIEQNTNDFKSVPTTVKTFENDSVLLPCYLQNAGTGYHVRWLKDGKLIVDSSDDNMLPPNRVILYSNYSLQVDRLQPSDTGEYICEVVRVEPWSPIRQVHAIEVLYPPSATPIPDIGIIDVKIGDEVDIGCKVAGVPQPIISWFSNDEPLQLIDRRSRLKFKATSRHLAGNYRCEANNGVGEPVSANIQVIIMHPPEVETETPWVHTSVGLRSQLQCNVIASPMAKVHWFHGYNPVILSSRVITRLEGDIHYLVFRNVQMQDLGVYTCKAENKIGMAEIKMHLSGVANVAIFKTDPAKNHPTHTTYTLIWEVDSYSPIIEYNLWFRPYRPKPTQKDPFAKEKEDTWMKLIIPGEHNYNGPVHTTSYMIRGLTPSTVYEAQIVSRNKFGWSKPSSILHFATDSAVTSEPKSTERPIHKPVIEDNYQDSYSSNNFSNIYSTPMLESENVISMESSQRSSGSTLYYFISLNLCSFNVILYMCAYILDTL